MSLDRHRKRPDGEDWGPMYLDHDTGKIMIRTDVCHVLVFAAIVLLVSGLALLAFILVNMALL